MRDRRFELQVQEHGIGNCPVKRNDDQDEGDERNESNWVGSYAYQDRIEEQCNPKSAKECTTLECGILVALHYISLI